MIQWETEGAGEGEEGGAMQCRGRREEIETRESGGSSWPALR